MTLPANIRVNVRAPFPSRVVAGPGIALSKSNGIWTVGLDYADFASAPSLLSTQEWAIYDTAAKTFSMISLPQLVVYLLTLQRVAVADANYALSAGVGFVAYTSLTAARAVSLLPAADYVAGAQITVAIESGQGSAINTITLTPNGADTISGKSSAVLTGAYGYITIESDGVSKWTIVPRAPGRSSTCLYRIHSAQWT